MKFIKSIDELNEARQAPAKKLFKMVVDGSTSEIEGVKISKDMAQAALDWFDRSTYARKYEKQVKTAGMGAVAPLIFGDSWGIKKTISSNLKAEFKELQAQYKRVRPENESVTEKLARGLKPLLTLGSTLKKNAGEDVLLDLSDKFDILGDEDADNIASHLNMAIELMQDGYGKSATEKLKQFNKACKDALAGKEVGSAFESVVTEAATDRFLQSAARNLAKQMRGKSASRTTLMNRLNSMPLANMLKPDELEKIIDYAMQEMGLNESVVNEADKTPTMLLADDIEGAEFHHGFGDGTTVDARSTKKTWEDGVPVLKYIARAPKKSVKLPKGKFEVVIDDKYGWIYWQDKGVWYGMDKDDDYIPFEF